MYPIPLSERIDSSKKVIIGKVVSSNAYWDADSSNIYTAYTMEVICYAKNADSNNYFDLVLPGGTIEEDIQIVYPFMQLKVGYQYMVAVEDVSMYRLNRKHARVSRPTFQPYSYIQGILPMNNGYYHDYFDTTKIEEVILIDSIETITAEQAATPEGNEWFARDSFPNSHGDIDEDGVMDIYDIDPNNPHSDSDGDSYSDLDETQGLAGSIPSNPMNPCDPLPTAGLCIPIDLDADSLFSNFPPSHPLFDSNDNDPCEPMNLVKNGCSPVDADGDGFIKNTVSTDTLYDPDDANPCLPKSLVTAGCEPVDADEDGFFENIVPSSTLYDPDDTNACIPKKLISNGCDAVDADGDGFFANTVTTDILYDPDDTNACLPLNLVAFGCDPVDADNDGWYGNIAATDSLYDSNDNNPCIPINSITLGCDPIDGDGDGRYSNAVETDTLYDPDDTNPCIPKNLMIFGCAPVDFDEDGFYANAMSSDSLYDSEDTNPCVPNSLVAHGCTPIDLDEDGFFANTEITDTLFDTDDTNPCVPNNAISYGCNPVDNDGDGLFSNALMSDTLYDPDDTNPCVPNNLIRHGCAAIDGDGDGYYKNTTTTDSLYDPDDANPCIPDNYAGFGCDPIDEDGDGYFANVLENGDAYDTDDTNPCVPSNLVEFGCTPIDYDQDGFFENTMPSDTLFDSDDNNPCIPHSLMAFGCDPVDKDGDGLYANAMTSDTLYDPNDTNSCIPINLVAFGCTPIDKDGDGFFENTEVSDSLYDPNDTDPCIPDNYTGFGCDPVDEDGDGYFANTNPNGDAYDPDDAAPCIPVSKIEMGCEPIDIDEDGFFDNIIPSDTLFDSDDNNPCVPHSLIAFGCDPVDEDGDGLYANAMTLDTLYDPTDTDSCIPINLVAFGCTPIDADGDGFFDNTEPFDSLYDPNDTDPCIPDNYTGFNCDPVDEDGDGYFANTNPNGDAYDPDDNNPCIPNNLISFGCDPIDEDNDGLFSNALETDSLYDPDDTNPCIPQGLIEIGCEPIDEDGDGYFANTHPGASNYDNLDNNPCIPQDVYEIPLIIDTYLKKEHPGIDLKHYYKLAVSNKPGKEKRILIYFDNSQFPTHIPIEAFNNALTVKLKLFMLDASDISSTAFSFHRVLQPWGSQLNPIALTSWNSPGNGRTWVPGGDIDPNPMLTVSPQGSGWNYFDITSLYHQAINDPANNFGYMIKISQPENSSDHSFFSTESISPPKLIVQTDTAYCNMSAPLQRQTVAITLKNGVGQTTNNFVGGTIEENHEMVIQGSGFGNEPGYITFPNADSGGSTTTSLDVATDLIHWTDTEIRIKIPKKAGTGNMAIMTNNGTPIGTIPITISWSMNPIYHKPKTETSKYRQRTHFVNTNESGGYNLQLNTSTGFASNTEAVAAFERALTEWQCATNINWVLTETTNRVSEKDGECVIEFSTTLPQGVLAIASSRYKGSGNSSCPEHNLFWRIDEFDISFADPSILPAGFSWNYDTANPSASEFDFESIALHELGHAHGLAHVINESSAMHFSIGNGEQKRSLSTHELEGALHKMDHSTEENCINSYDPMVAISSPCETPAVTNKTQIKVLLEGFYDENSGNMSMALREGGLIPANQPFNKPPFNYTGTESASSIPMNVVDWILLELRDAENQENILYQKALFLQNDGTVVNIDGTNEISLEGVTSGAYYVCIAHANHLSVISNSTHAIHETAQLYDFSNTNTAAMGSGQLKEINGLYYLHSGDFDGNGLINNQDYNLWKVNSSSLNIYSPADADGNGIINSLDYNLWKINLSKIGVISR